MLLPSNPKPVLYLKPDKANRGRVSFYCLKHKSRKTVWQIKACSRPTNSFPKIPTIIIKTTQTFSTKAQL